MRWLAIFGLAGLVACASPAASLRVQGDAFAPGDEVPGSLVNESSVYELQHGVLCLAWLEVLADEAWTRAKEPDRACILPLLITPPSSAVLFRYALAPELATGQYRLRFEVQRGRFRLLGFPVGGTGDSVTLASPAFTVRRTDRP